MKLLLAFLFCLLISPLHADSPGPLQVQPAPGWSMDFKEENNIPLYTIYKKKSEHPTLTISIWPLPGSDAKVPQYFESMIQQFLAEAGSDSQNKLADTAYTTESLSGDSISGEMATFKFTSGLIKTLAMFSDGERIWSSQYSGSKEEWNDALALIRKLKKK